jgi:hypothetical protein
LAQPQHSKAPKDIYEAAQRALERLNSEGYSA